MSFSHEQPNYSGASSSESGPQVVVRAGKTFICTACGTLVEVPADVVGQLVIAVEPSPPEEPVKEVVETSTPPAEAAQSNPDAEQRPKSNPRPKPKRASFAGTMIDGLRVPSAKELDRALNWVSFHLTVLDRQGSEIRRLQKTLKRRACQPGAKHHPQQGKHCARPNNADGTSLLEREVHAQDDRVGSVLPVDTQERGPPDTS